MNVDERFYELTAHLWRGGSYAYYWTPDSKSTEGGACAYTQWIKVTEPESVSDMLRNVNVFFGIHPSHTLKRANERATIADIQAVNCLFAEFDLEDGQDADHLLESIKQIDIQPSVIVFSGGGYHCYWLFDEPYKIYGDDSRTWIIDLQYAWVDWLGADSGAKDLARVLRVPGTLNRKPKYAPDYPTVDIVKFDMSTAYTFDELHRAVESIIAVNKKKEYVDAQIAPVNVPSDIKDRLEKMLHDDAGAAALWVGDLTAYKNDASSGDLALCNRLTFWFGRDKSMVDMMFRQSNLMRPKWDREMYRNKTLDKAIDDTAKVYDPVNYYNNLNGNPQNLVNPTPISTAQAQATQTATNGTGATNGAIPPKSSQATQSAPQPSVTPVTSRNNRKNTSADYIQTLTNLGYTFKLNDLDDTIEINNRRLDDVVASTVRSQMRDEGYENMQAIEDSYVANAAKSHYHPVKDYLQNLAWNGNDWIQTLAAFANDGHPPIQYTNGTFQSVFYVWVKRWLIGAVAKVFDQEQNPMLVLDGTQNLGKSTFARWLGSGMPNLFFEGAIRPDDKDYSRYLATSWIWEVAELGSTTRRQDVEALKNFLTMRYATFRKPYGKHPVTKPALSSFIGTINNETGFLTDTTGNRRYLSVKLIDLDWNYQDIDIHQLWAQAYALWNAGAESHRLLPEEILARDGVNSTYQVEDPYESWILKYYDVDPDESKWRTTTQEVTDLIQSKGVKGETRAVQMQLNRTLKTLGLTKDLYVRPIAWKGIRLKSWMPTP
jgi:predicted P-loop ATPase